MYLRPVKNSLKLLTLGDPEFRSSLSGLFANFDKREFWLQIITLLCSIQGVPSILEFYFQLNMKF